MSVRGCDAAMADWSSQFVSTVNFKLNCTKDMAQSDTISSQRLLPNLVPG